MNKLLPALALLALSTATAGPAWAQVLPSQLPPGQVDAVQFAAMRARPVRAYSGPALQARPTAPWTQQASMVTARGQHAGVSVGGKAYIWGGYTGQSGSIATTYSSLEIFNPVTNTWSAGASYPVQIRGAATAVGNDGLIYSFSGVISGFTSDSYRYSPTANTWTAIASIPSAVWLASAAVDAAGKIHVFGGYTSSIANSQLHQIYDPTTNTWASGTPLPTGRHGHVTVKDANGLLHVIGGITGTDPSNVVALHEVYNPTTNTWTTLAPLPVGVNQAGGTLGADGNIYVVGGKDNYINNSPSFFSTVYVYTSATNTWSMGTSLPITLSETKAVTVDGNIYAVGGANGSIQAATYQMAVAAAATVATVTTAPATNLAATSATLGGEVTNNGGAAVTERGVVYTTNAGLTPTISNANKVAMGAGTGSFSQTVSGLSAGTTYLVGTYATNSAGTSYGNLLTFSTSAAAPQDLVINTGSATSPVSIAAGTYGTITITGTGYAQLGGSVRVNTAIAVQDGGTLNTNCQSLTGAGSFTLAAGGTLGICDPAGITTSGATGAVQLTGSRSFSDDANYVYNSATTQNAGTGLPARVRNLTINNTTNRTATVLNAPTSVAQVLAVQRGVLATNNQVLTLLSSATGTALHAPVGEGLVAGPITVQRYIDGSINPGLGYRHFAAPVERATVASLASATGNGGFTPVLTQSYNTSATPGTTTPFPNVFFYDQGRLANNINDLAPFDKGFVVPENVNSDMPLAVGFAVNIAAGQTVSFTGQLTDVRVADVGVSRGAGPDAGWNLLGNPYAAPLDWSKFTNLSNVDRAMYIVQSTGQYAGGYRAYVNGQSNTGNANPLIASGQGFWVRVSANQTQGFVNFNTAFLVTDYATAQQATFQRPAADARPALRLTLAGNGLADGWLTYAETGATPAFDGQYDAAKLANSTGLNLSSATGTNDIAIDAQAAYSEATVLPLNVGVPAAGAYTLALAELRNLPAGLTPYLRDALTGTTTALAAGTSYGFSVTDATALVRGRFALVFRPGTITATNNGLKAAQVSVYPNPAREQFTVQVPAISGASAVQAELLNALGQVVRRQSAALPAAGATFTVPTAGLATGVYTLRLQAGASSLAKRVVVQ